MKMMTMGHSKAQKMLQRNLSDKKGKKGKTLMENVF